MQVLLRGASGALKIGGGVLAVVGAVGAVFAVVATGGLAAPIIVGTAGALTTVFAASDVVEGVGDVKAAITKEGLDKRSYNPIRDDVFGGNELAYALTGTGISLVTDIVTGAVIAKIPERISASMAAKSAKRAAKKAAQDAAKAARAAENAKKAAQTVKVAKTAETVEKTEEAAKAVSAAERFYSELDALKLKAQEIPHTLTAEEARACEAVKLQMKGELSAVSKVSVEEVEKVDEVVKVTSTTSDTVVVPKSSRAVVPETVVENANMGAGKTYKEVNVHGIINTEIDEVDLINHIIYEDKSASKLYMKNADFLQTEHQWAFKQIYKKGSNRVDAINQSEYTLSIVGSENIPSIDSLKSIRVYIFRIDMDTPTLRQAVEQCLGKLREKYPGYNFLAMYGGK